MEQPQSIMVVHVKLGLLVWSLLMAMGLLLAVEMRADELSGCEA
jgi:hypothetical protein